MPTPARWPGDGRTEVAAWFPLVGAGFGLGGHGLVRLAHLLGYQQRAPFVVAGIVISAWALLGRFLHWDGLADVADGYWGSHDPARRREIMSDSLTGAFGATAVSLTALLQVTALGSFLAASHTLPVLAVPIFGQFSATVAAWAGKPARPGGLGRSVMGRPTILAVAICAVPVIGAFVALWLSLHVPGLVLGGLGMLAAAAVPHLLAGRFGGVTGDVLGASILLIEALLLVALALAG